jgi:hypothetical protein
VFSKDSLDEDHSRADSRSVYLMVDVRGMSLCRLTWS